MEVCLKDNSLKRAYSYRCCFILVAHRLGLANAQGARVQLSTERCFRKNSSQKLKACLAQCRRHATGWSPGLNEKGGKMRVSVPTNYMETQRDVSEQLPAFPATRVDSIL